MEPLKTRFPFGSYFCHIETNCSTIIDKDCFALRRRDGNRKLNPEKIDTLVIGAGQAGIAISEHLSDRKIPHIVLERAGIAEKWRSGRWDSLVANGPAWHDRFPNLEFCDLDPDSFANKERVADYFAQYAKMINSPIRCGVEVTKVEKNIARQGFSVETTAGMFEADSIVAATGAFQKPVMPSIVPEEANVLQLHSADYKNPAQLPDGGVLVVGAGSSGSQIANELLGSGRKVYLSIGPHDRPPRRYRGRDNVWWLGILGKWDAATPAPGTEHVTIAVSGYDGGHTVDFRKFEKAGMMLTGMVKGYMDGAIIFSPDIAENIRRGDSSLLAFLDEADAFTSQNGLDLPEDPDMRIIGADTKCMLRPLENLNLAESGISTILWATGYNCDYHWLRVNAFDQKGNPHHHRGISKEPGIYFLGLPWLSRRGSSFIWGVWEDAKYIADYISTQRNYMAYSPSNAHTQYSDRKGSLKAG